VCRLLLGLLVDELARLPEDDVEVSYGLSLFLVLHADDPSIAIANNAAELYAACTALVPSIGPSVQSCLETIQAYSCAHDVFQHILELKGLISTPDSNGCIKPFPQRHHSSAHLPGCASRNIRRTRRSVH